MTAASDRGVQVIDDIIISIRNGFGELVRIAVVGKSTLGKSWLEMQIPDLPEAHDCPPWT